MNTRPQYFLFLLVFILVNSCATKEKIAYHRVYTGTYDARPVVVDLWNDSSGDKLIRETTDEKNRVIKIEFLTQGKLSGHGNFPVAKITYEYQDHKIIETAYDKDEKNLYVDKHASHYKSIYYLDENGFIEKVDRVSDFKTRDPVWKELNMEPPSRADLEKESKDYHTHFYEGRPLEVEFYKYSYYKFNGIYPISKDYKIDSDYENKYMDTWMEIGIEDGIKKLLKSK